MGRDPELRRLRDALARGAHGTAVVALAGEAGIGKSLLARWVSDLARDEGSLVIEGRADPVDAHLPLGVFRSAIRSYRRRHGDEAVGTDPLAAAFSGWLLPEAAPPHLAGDDPGLDVLFEAATRYLAAVATPRGLVLVLEDLHLAAPSSCSLIVHLARTLAHAPVLMVLTYRLDEMTAPLAELRHEMARDRIVDELPLSPLPERSVGLMLEVLLGVPPAPSARAWIARASGGNPFIVEELARAAVESGRLDPRSGDWLPTSQNDTPWTVREMLLARGRRLDPEDRETLRWAAVIGHQFDVPMLAAASGRDEAETIAALGRISRTGLIGDDDTAPEPGTLTFRHALTRDAVLSELLAVDLRQRHARVLEATERIHGDSPGLVIEHLVTHALAAGDHGRGFEYSVRAARSSIEIGAPQEADVHLSHALDLWEPAFGDRVHAELVLERGRVQAALGAWSEAVWTFAEAVRLMRDAGDAEGRAVASALEAEARWELPDRRRVIEDLVAASNALPPQASPGSRLEVMGRLARVRLLAGEATEAAETARAALALPLHRPSRRHADDALHARITLGAAQCEAGDARAGAATLTAALNEALARRNDAGILRAHLKLAMCAYATPAVAGAHADAAIALSRDHGLHRAEARALLARAAVHVEAGEWDQAMALADEMDMHLRQFDADATLRMGLGIVRATGARRKGDLSAAVETFTEIAAQAEALMVWEWDWRARVGMARTRMAAGDPMGAREALTSVIARVERSRGGPTASQAPIALTGIEIAAMVEDAHEAERLTAILARRTSGPRVSYARALCAIARGDPPPTAAVEAAAREVEAEGRRPEAARMLLTAAETLAQTESHRDDAALMAAAALRCYRELQADEWCRRAEGLLRRLGRRVPVSLREEPRDGLTAREREVLSLVAEGLSNRGIAARLVISESTAARHVFNIFAKLGVHTRAQATRLALESGLLADRDDDGGDPAAATHRGR